MTIKWNRVTIIGCGLIGASFALALRRADACARLAGWDSSPSVLDEALRRGVIDEVDGSFASGCVSSSDLIYLAMPVGEIIGFLRERGLQVKPGALVTDAGSTKQEVCRAAREQFPKNHGFVGGHPVAGSHLTGLKHARADLFTGAPYVLTTAEDERDRQEVFALEQTLGLFGARVMLMTAGEHDRAMALVSHLPQLVSSALAATIKDQPDGVALISLSGAGYRDMTRLADSSWLVWRDILVTNPTLIAAALDALLTKLTDVRNELHEYSERAGTALGVTSVLFEESGRT
ncbi:MAG: prephenate dehydrogenase/arogenate dehydrogenase family protein [Acidobacteriota bacterium]|nr:prephenate dehydrogenase/arogenate dehydrogenase family protein [Acidobacteriota bacterium]